MKIEQRDDPFGTNEKRFRFPCSITDTCPVCGREVELDFSNAHYLTNPTFNGPQEIVFHCIDWDENGEEILDCEHRWTAHILLQVTVKETKAQDERR